MIKTHRQREIIFELNEQIEFLKIEMRLNGQSVTNLVSIGQRIGRLKIAIAIVEGHLWMA